MDEAAPNPPTLKDQIDDTPAEPGFLWRRLFTFVGSLISAALTGLIIVKVGESGVLKWIALALIGANVVREGFYMGGASLADWALLTKAWRQPPQA